MFVHIMENCWGCTVKDEASTDHHGSKPVEAWSRRWAWSWRRAWSWRLEASLKLEAAAGGGLAERSSPPPASSFKAEALLLLVWPYVFLVGTFNSFLIQKREKKKIKQKAKKYSGRITYTGRNRLKFWPRWNIGVPRTGLHAGTRFSVRSGRNGTDYTTLILPCDQKLIRVTHSGPVWSIKGSVL